MSILTFDHRVAGMPCKVEILSIDGDYVPAKTNADPDSCYPAEYPEIEWQLLDRRGRPAPWLEAKLTSTEREEIEHQCFVLTKKESYHEYDD
jgi:hypothetical protein